MPVPTFINIASSYFFNAPYCFSARAAHFPSFLILYVIPLGNSGFKRFIISKFSIPKLPAFTIISPEIVPGDAIPISSTSSQLISLLESK